MIRHIDINYLELYQKLKHKQITYGGNSKLKIYGTLLCKSGKRMKKEHRVFFRTKEEAVKSGYRPCGHCMKTAYKYWKDGLV
ncbi:metal-binding protein [Marivirga sp. S37H4]|uniref:Metal-binding protein n=1 Tax=Marivirga aurantiaca TaxID=2802615 RepID=A0A934X0N0_9BACT|nr:Ada metal-binding domain-containing protein [Marivirga aurantiaca]MBK6266287.1 metal-binding protein [Marivirga aurantiaca]